ncbi:uncharacterized protein I303_105240 [Kwoniella dejecticola CBS 10117]
MGEICHWAGEEARRADGGLGNVRTWSELAQMTEAERKADNSDWPDFTNNIVLINVAGPNQPNFDVEDLPGLNGHNIPLKLVSDCISQPQNLIVLCLSAGSKDASSADPEVQLARRYDPTGQRTIGVITRADLLVPSLDDGSTFVDYLLDEGDHLGGYRPAGGWWPLRLRTHQERTRKVSLLKVREVERELFAESDWIAIQGRVGRQFGIAELEMKLEELFGHKVRENIILIKRSLSESMQEHDQWLVANPTIDDPVGALHDEIIYRVSENLRNRIQLSNQSGNLVDLQSQLEKDIQKAVPEFMPFTADEEVQEGYNSFCKSQGFYVDSRDQVFADQLLEKIKQYTSRRNPDEIDSRAIMQSYQDNYVKRWNETATKHVDVLWVEVDKLLLEVTKEMCGGSPALLDVVIARLGKLKDHHKNDTLRFIEEARRLYSSPPEDLISASKSRLTQMKDESYQHFLRHLNQPLMLTPPSSLSSSATRISSPASSTPRVLHDTMSVEEREKCARYQAKIGIIMISWAIEFSSIVGKYAQSRVTGDYTKEVIPALRKGMGLDEVVESVRKRAGDVFESDRKKKREREMRANELRKLNEIQKHLEKISDY